MDLFKRMRVRNLGGGYVFGWGICMVMFIKIGKFGDSLVGFVKLFLF